MQCAASRGYQLPMRVEGHQNTEACQQGHHRSAAIADEWQWHADDRQQAADHAGVDEYVNEKRQCDAAGEQTCEGVLRFHGEIQGAPYYEQIQQQQNGGAEQPELFTDHGVDEVRGALGQELELSLRA